MEEKETTFSGSLGNSDTDSPPPISFTTTTTTTNNNNNNTAVSSPHVVNAAAAVNFTSELTPLGPTQQPQMTAVNNIAVGTSSVDLSSGKKKRGRPRKYDADGNLRPGQTATTTARRNSGHVNHMSPPPGFSLTRPHNSSSEFSSKRGRGRPAGSGNWQVHASLETAVGEFTPHVVTVGTGEDVAGRILSFSEKGPRGICILAANGAVSNVTIRQPGSSGGILTYEGRFELLSLSGSFTVSEIGGVRSRTGALSVSLAGPDGRVIGGGVAGMLTAASPIQIVVGSFMPNGHKALKKKHYREDPVASPISGAPDPVTAASPISQAQPEHETRFTPIVPTPAQSLGEANKSMSQNQNFNFMPTTAAIVMPNSAGWNGMELKSDHRPSPDINLSVHGN